ncbi:hypothetical protein [Aestuariivirga sp.]|uniref:hypothetical protein n=1 Tax=Aestuariivirga sp. TaxID=2650926 RepID=UPI0039E4D7D5
MAAGRTIGLAILGTILGIAAGGGLGLLGGLGWTELMSTSSFEGYSGFVVAYWILGGLILGALAGLISGVRLARRR